MLVGYFYEKRDENFQLEFGASELRLKRFCLKAIKSLKTKREIAVKRERARGVYLFVALIRRELTGRNPCPSSSGFLAEGEGVFFGASGTCEKEIRRPV